MNRTSSPTRCLAALLLIAVASCSPKLSTPDSKADLPTGRPKTGPNDAFPLPPLEFEKQLESGPMEVRTSKPAGAGVTGASKLTVYLTELKREVTVKWKTAPNGYDGWNNSPRKEIAAYEIQKLFLEPRDFVVPPTVMRCVEMAEADKIISGQKSNVRNGSCALGMLTVWIENVEPIKDPLDRERFRSDPTYAHHVANFNVLTYLVDHRDGRFGNFFVSKPGHEGRLFAIDNGISFGPWIYNYFVRNWNEIYVPGLSKETVERLRRLEEKDFDRLATVSELRRGGDGLYRNVEPDRPLDDDAGVRVRDRVIQLGLTDEEIEDLIDRWEDLIEAIDSGRVAVF